MVVVVGKSGALEHHLKLVGNANYPPRPVDSSSGMGPAV